MTIQSAPLGNVSVHDDLIFTVYDAHSTDATTYPNYKYIADIYINSVMVARLKKIPDPVTNIGIFNIEQVVRNYVQAVFNPALSLKSEELGLNLFYIDLQLKFGEEYSFTSYYNIVSSTYQKVFNNYNRLLFGTTTSLSSLADKIISNAPTTLQVYSNQSYSFLTYFPTSTSAINISVATSNGGSYSTTVTPSAAYYLQVLNLSPVVLNALSAGLINAVTQWYNVTIGSQVYHCDVVCEPRYTTYEIHFLNQYGGYDTKLFNKVSRKIISLTKSSFGLLPYTVDASGVVSYYNANNVYNESQHTYASQYTEKLSLNSDILTDAEYTWLYDLIVSTQVYINMNGFFYGCNITDTNYEPKKQVNDSLTNLLINIEFGKTFNAQYR